MEAQVHKISNPIRHRFGQKPYAFKMRFHITGKSRHEEVLEICEGIIDIIAVCFCVSGKELRSQDRANAGIARVRQVGMYISHVCLGLTMKEVATGFCRDRSTVVHACHLIEDLRDDPDFDRICSTVGRIAVAAFGADE